MCPSRALYRDIGICPSNSKDDDESMESGTDFSDESDDICSPELDKTTGNDDSSSDSEETGLSDENGGIDDQPARVDKPADAGKTYYIDDFMNCLKTTFKACRGDSSFQCIDEQMTKFKGRSSFKQYMPLKPEKRGIKMWLRCDSLTGYTYDMSIYCGKEGSVLEGTLGERGVNGLAATISNLDVTLCFDRFFTTVNLINNIQYPALRTCMSNRKNVPKIPEKLQRGEAIFKVNSAGTIAVKWQDVKEVMLLSNCHTSEMSTVRRKMKDGTEAEFPCPDIVKTHRAIVGGVDLGDQMSGLYDINRKSNKWWKKVFYRGMMMAAVNTWVISSAQI
ncbi:piggyBac transposable element-derived protein 3-like [Anastrepha obliqua]|uniref:piggyBac transposable element-derived protein 3-like n=1 Tax=Anastrepha obliqua TaxID=95512 RepID=UPI002409DF2F|nr:piggyBac transposable element-derived protein 3-like [Anastrepha obliqua]